VDLSLPELEDGDNAEVADVANDDEAGRTADSKQKTMTSDIYYIEKLQTD